MSPEHERFVDATKRAHDLDHAVREAETSAREHPDDAMARAKLEMAMRIRDEASKALIEAKRKFEQSTAAGDDGA